MNDIKKIAPALERLRRYASDKHDVQLIPTYDLQKMLQSHDALAAALRSCEELLQSRFATPDTQEGRLAVALVNKIREVLP